MYGYNTITRFDLGLKDGIGYYLLILGTDVEKNSPYLIVVKQIITCLKKVSLYRVHGK